MTMTVATVATVATVGTAGTAGTATTLADCDYSTSSPAMNDVLCGKDKTYAKHPGNQVYRALIEQEAIVYASKSKPEKMLSTRRIVSTMNAEHGARFLRLNGDNWEEISNQQARDKTSHALRFCSNSLHGKAAAAGAAATRSTRTTRTVQSTQAKKSHRRLVSRESINTSPLLRPNDECNSNNAAADDADEYLFQRQRAILTAYSTYDSYDAMEQQQQSSAAVVSPVPPPMPPHRIEPLPVHTSSEDLDAILKEPLNENDWDGLFLC